MRQWLSALVIALGLLHVLSVVLVDGADLLDLASAGVGALPYAPGSQRAAFYSAMFGILAAAAGQVMFWTSRRVGAIPATPGIVLMLVGTAGGLAAPRSPFWVAVVLGALVVAVSRLPREDRKAPGARRVDDVPEAPLRARRDSNP